MGPKYLFSCVFFRLVLIIEKNAKGGVGFVFFRRNIYSVYLLVFLFIDFFGIDSINIGISIFLVV